MQNKPISNQLVGDGGNDLERFKEITWSDDFDAANTIKGAEFWVKADQIVQQT
jgi:hypothetical protein